ELGAPIERLDSEILKFNLAGYSKLHVERRQAFIKKSLVAADKWLSKGVRLHLCVREPKFRSCIHLFRVIFSFGPLNALNKPTVMIMNSRTGRKIQPGAAWLNKTANLVKYSVERNWTVVSSYGAISYFVVSWIGKGHHLIVVCDGVLPFMDTPEAERKFYDDFSDFFDMRKTLFLSGFTPGFLPRPRNRWIIRDQMVASISTIMAPCEIRPDGIMAGLLQSAHSTDKVVISHQPERTRKKVTPKRLIIGTSSAFSQFLVKDLNEKYEGQDLLFHYTRACFGPWPGQTWSNYLYDLMNHETGSAHDALDTLIRILTERKIRANDNWTRGSTPVISFTEIGPRHFARIRKWRRGLIRYTFEPYALAFSKKALVEKGVTKVVYGSEQDFMGLPDAGKPFFQVASSSCNDWTAEKEWRFPGDLDFRTMQTSDWFVIVPDHESAYKVLGTVVLPGLRVHNGNFGITDRNDNTMSCL
ncbi:MAG: hypothetical protein ACP5U1_15055, partial [Desulfomonilaceae bacterium]